MNNKAICVALLALIFISAVYCEPRKITIQRKHLFKEYLHNRNVALFEQGLATSNYNTPLDGSEDALGEYYIDITLGTPPEKFTVQLDTGSSDLAIPGYTCSCGQTADPGYNPKESSTSSEIMCDSKPSGLTCPSCDGGQCAYNITYGDGSGFGAIVDSDACSVAGLNFSQYFGEITSEKTGSLPYFEPSSIDGICGVAYPVLSEIQAPTIIDNMVSAGYIDDVFSMCMTNSGGQLTLGGIGSHYTGTVQYTPIIKELYYNVYFADVKVYGSSVGVPTSTLNKGSTIVDSGTTYIYLGKTVYGAIKSAFLNNCDNNYLTGICDVASTKTFFDGYCYSLSSSELQAFPPISIGFGQSSPIYVNVQPSTYLQTGMCTNPTAYALAMGSQLDAFGNIFGDTFMQNFETIFDRANQRMGFATVSGCPSS